MTRIIGVRFRNVGKVYYFSPKEFEINSGDHVIVETARGVEYGTVVLSPRDVEDEKVVQPLKDVIRVATPEDDEHEAVNHEKEREAFDVCLKKIREHELEMKLIDVEYTFDNNKVLFYFTADGRIDFRELVKDLAAIFKTRIELRQIGVRDETKILGGIGICGRPLCCHTYLSEFAPVSIKMAKDQNLSLNPTKISGTCGRLMCCLKNEQETYEYLNKKLPGIGDTALTPDGLKGEVHSVNVLRQMVKVLVQVDNDELELRDFKVEDLKFIARKKDKQKKDLEKELEKELDPELIAELQSLEESPEERKPQEKKHSDKKPKQGEKRGFDKKSGEKSQSGEKSVHEKNVEEKIQGEKVSGEKNQSEKASGEKKQGGRSQSEKFSGAKKQGDKNQGEKRLNDKKVGDKSLTEKNAGENKTDDRNPADKKFADRKPADRRPNDKKQEQSTEKAVEMVTGNGSENGSDREKPKFKKKRHRGKEKYHDNQTASEGTPG